MQHHFFDGDSGFRICTYPNGKLGQGMRYDTLVGSGFSYPVIASLVADGNLTGAMKWVKTIRARQNGKTASPWNEPECNDIYSRQMAGWNLFDQSCGFKYDSVRAALGFDPKMNQTAFQCFFAAEDGWGQFAQTGTAGLATGTVSLKALHGSVKVSTLMLTTTATVVTATLGTAGVAATISGGLVEFKAPVVITEGAELKLSLSGGVPTAAALVELADECCPDTSKCCPDTSKCCPDTSKCCPDTSKCCPDTSKCCPDTSKCCPDTSKCCPDTPASVPHSRLMAQAPAQDFSGWEQGKLRCATTGSSCCPAPAALKRRMRPCGTPGAQQAVSCASAKAYEAAGFDVGATPAKGDTDGLTAVLSGSGGMSAPYRALWLTLTLLVLAALLYFAMESCGGMW